MKYIIFVVLWGISQADAQTLTAEVTSAHKVIDEKMNDIKLAIRRLDTSFVETILQESKTSLIAVVQAFVNTLPTSHYVSVHSFTTEIREQFPRAVETMFTVDYGQRGVQNIRRQFQQALKAYINVPASTFDIYKVDANGGARLIMTNLVRRAINEALSSVENVSSRLSPTPRQ